MSIYTYAQAILSMASSVRYYWLKTPPGSKMKLKLFINKHSNTVLYAEAGKHVVDFLLNVSMMPLCVAMREVFDGAAGGGLATLFKSVADDLSEDYLQACLSTKGYVKGIEYNVEGRGDGYVKGHVTYMITDDLAVRPLLSTSLSITLLSQLGVKDFGCIQETEVTLDSNQARELIKASLTSKTLLTHTFLPLKTQE